MNDCLFLPYRQGSGQGSGGTRTLGGWEALWTSLGEGEAEGLAGGGGDGWEAVAVPGQQAAVAGRSAIWYRTRFPRPDHNGRVLLRLGGAFLAANVWLNGRLLGSHYGYFAPFGFDVTPFLREENLLVVCCESPVEQDLSRKRHVLGIFADGDSRPYPGSAWFSLPESYRWEVPVGLWRPVELEYVGPVVLDWVHLNPSIEAGDAGRLEIEARLRNLDGREMAGELVVEVEGPGQGAPVRLRREFRLPGGTELTLAMTLTVAGAQRWQPWRLGRPVLYRAAVSALVEGRESTRVEDRFGFRELAVHAAPEGWSVILNGRPFFLRGADYEPGLVLDHLTEAVFDADLSLARDANLDALRVHGHVLPEEFYRRADEAGMLVVADFPLTLSYAYHAGVEETRFFETAVREQVPEMVELLRNRPSVALWVAHDDPPWIAANAELGDVHAVRQNYTLDQEVRELFERLDPSRTALAASGDLDRHVWAGWKEGRWSDFAGVRAGLVSEFGAQALPSLDSPVWDTLGRRWPITGDDPDWLYAGYQLPQWAEHGVGLPTEHDRLEDYVELSQRYQAYLLHHAIDQFRKHKLEPCWGAFVFQLVDPFPGIGFGLLDHARRPRLAYQAVREAMAPVRVLIDPVGYTALEPWGMGWRRGDPVTARLVVVNDDPRLAGPAEVRWSVYRDRAPERTTSGWLRDAIRRKSFSGSAEVALPTASEPAVQVTALSLPLDAEGEYRLEAELRVGGRAVAATSIGFRIAAVLETQRRRPLLPGYLADRLVVGDSLAADADGLSFTIRNQTRPAVLTGIEAQRLDGRPLAVARILVETPSGRVPLPRRLDLPVGRPVRVVIEPAQPIEAGEHQLEVDLTVPGVAGGRVRVDGRTGSVGQPPSY